MLSVLERGCKDQLVTMRSSTPLLLVEAARAAGVRDAAVLDARRDVPLVGQLAEGGRLVQPIGPGGRENVLLFEKRGARLRRRRFVTAAHFVPLYGEHGFPP